MDHTRQCEKRELSRNSLAYQTPGESYCAISYHEDSLKLARLRGDLEQQFDTLMHLSNVYETLGYIHYAVACHIQRVNDITRTIDFYNSIALFNNINAMYSRGKHSLIYGSLYSF
jgi:hypothetical protein